MTATFSECSVGGFGLSSETLRIAVIKVVDRSAFREGDGLFSYLPAPVGMGKEDNQSGFSFASHASRSVSLIGAGAWPGGCRCGDVETFRARMWDRNRTCHI